MARWYSAFANSNIVALDNYSAQRLTMGGSPSTLKTNALNARAALSAAFAAQIDLANNNGTLGTVVPNDGYTRSGGTLSGTNLYTNTLAVYQSNPQVRPSSTTVPNPTPITVANSTAVSPADPWSISETVYTDATSAVQAILTNIANIGAGTGGGPYSRLGLNAYRTLASLYHDADMTYFAWDDFTPGKPQNVNVVAFGSGTVSFTITWNVQFPNDLNGQILITGQLERRGFGQVASLNVTRAVGPLTEYNWEVSGLTTPGTYDISVQLTLYDPIITTNVGETATRDIMGILVIP